MPTPDEVQDALTFDPLDAAEKITGKPYGGDFGMGMALLHNEEKRRILAAAGDTNFNTTHSDFNRILAGEGFVPVYQQPYTAFTPYNNESTDEIHTLWWNAGVLVEIATYSRTSNPAGPVVNSAQMYYNIEFPADYNSWSVTSSGHFNTELYDLEENGKGGRRRVWVGDHDIREGFRHNLNRLREAGTFLTEWVERPYLRLIPYGSDIDEPSMLDDGYKAVQAYIASRNEAVISVLPEHVRKAITP